jgi:hypothetical protein
MNVGVNELRLWRGQERGGAAHDEGLGEWKEGTCLLLVVSSFEGRSGDLCGVMGEAAYKQKLESYDVRKSSNKTFVHYIHLF